LNERLSLHSN